MIFLIFGSLLAMMVSSTTAFQFPQTGIPSNLPALSRRAYLGTNGVVLVGTLFVGNNPAGAKYGVSTNMELPNYIEYLVEKNSQSDSNSALYKGADPVVLLRRLQDAEYRLQEIPKLAEARQWSQIQGLLTGPLGMLSQTLNQIAGPDSDSKVQAASKKVKADLIAIGQAASQKNNVACVAMVQEASKDFVSFLEIAFE